MSGEGGNEKRGLGESCYKGSIAAIWPVRLPTVMCLAVPLRTKLVALEQAAKAAEVLEADAFALLARKAEAMPKEVAGFDTTWFKGVSYEVDGRGRSGLLEDLRYYSFSRNGSHILEAYRQISGNFLGPLTVAEGRNAFHVRTLFHCWEQITAAEAARGQRYKYWIFARLDWLWLALPPALSTFQRADPAAVWIPDGQDWDGINDRFAVVPRRYAKPYFGRWPWLVNGSLLPMMLRAATRSRSEVSPDLYRGPEWSLLAALHWYRLPVRRFGSTGAVLCLGGRRAKYGRCTRRKRPSDLSYKYSGEVSESSANVLLLRDGWTWRFLASPRLEPPCFDKDGEEKWCCSTQHGVAGHCQPSLFRHSLAQPC
ncbi:unnamed protein product [Symbiodinium necroappetens]|uniref:Uncharacterized protein n=1 Tax=Symbiodinium necroappetens TaxID=1628268 RepID=A0A812L282_9DINO|nr:unnamed protein product [Symbiodinium necroappetens]